MQALTDNVDISAPFCTSHNLAVVSILPVATTVLCGLNAKHTCEPRYSTSLINYMYTNPCKNQNYKHTYKVLFMNVMTKSIVIFPFINGGQFSVLCM